MNVKLTDFVISDLHLGHKNILEFSRPEFKTLEEMQAHIIACWNAVVTPEDTTIILGDLTIGKKMDLHLLAHLNGRKKLILGNHDTESLQTYLQYFDEVGAIGQARCVKPTWRDAGQHNGERIILTHIPVHPQCMDRFAYNVHGHLHTHFIQNQHWPSIRDFRYINVSCEVINYTPVKLEALFSMKATVGRKTVIYEHKGREVARIEEANEVYQSFIAQTRRDIAELLEPAVPVSEIIVRYKD